MPSINMIAPRRTEMKRLEKIARRLLLAILVQVIVIVCVAGVILTRTIRINGAVKEYDVQLSTLQPTVAKIETLNKTIASLEPKVEVLNDAKTESLRWCRIMDCLSTSMPDKTWLTRLNTTLSENQKGEIQVNMSGISESQNLVGETMLRMHDQVRDFSKVDLKFTQKAASLTSSAVEFEIAATIKDTSENSKQEVKKN